jgi:hypothetical protein
MNPEDLTKSSQDLLSKTNALSDLCMGIRVFINIIKDKNAQITALKEIAIRERNRYLVDFIHEYDDVRDCKEEAHKQLESEYEAMRK